jgi:hypothetical protein
MLTRPGRLAVLALSLWLAPFLPAQEVRSDTLFTVEKYLDYEQVADPQLSPDGSQIIYTRRYVDKLADRWESALWLVNADGSKNRFLLKGSSARWSPDGTRILYTADGEPSGTQVFVRWMDAEGAASQITRVTEPIGDVRWSRDGRSIGFSMFVPTKNELKITLPGPMTIVDTIADEHYGDKVKLAMAFAELLNQEARALEQDGVDVIQFDEPAFNVYMDDVKRWGISALHRAIEGLKCTTAVHICYGYGIQANIDWKKTLGAEWRQDEEIDHPLAKSPQDQV